MFVPRKRHKTENIATVVATAERDGHNSAKTTYSYSRSTNYGMMYRVINRERSEFEKDTEYIHTDRVD